jgi:hypothetical protein
MDGKIGALIDALITHFQAEKMKEQSTALA